MKSKDKKDASPEAARVETATPFFARFLEGQDADADAKVSEGRNQQNFTYKESARGSKKGGAKATTKTTAAGKSSQKASAARPPLITLKYPSDKDEYVFYPYHLEAATAKHGGGKAVTLKYPSDNDEGDPYYAVYADAKEAPKAGARAAAKPKDANVRLTRKKPKG